MLHKAADEVMLGREVINCKLSRPIAALHVGLEGIAALRHARCPANHGNSIDGASPPRWSDRFWHRPDETKDLAAVKECLFWLVDALVLQPGAVSRVSKIDLPSSKLFNALEACDGIERDQVVHNQIRTGRPACPLIAREALFADSIPVLHKGGYLL